MISPPSTVEYIVDQQIRQVQNVQALQPINGPQVVGVDGSKTPPQVRTMVSPMDGELPRPSTVGNDFYRKAREIRRDPTIRMVRELAMAPLLMAEWEYEADDDAPIGAKELVEKIMQKMRLPLLRTSLCGMTDYGWQPYEVIAEQREDGTSEPRLKPLLQDITSILVNAADGSFFGLRQTPVIGVRIGWIYLLDQECLVISQDVEGTNWYGEPTLRSLEKSYDESEVVSKSARKYDAKIAGTHWVIYYPLGTSDYGGQTLDNGEIAQKLLQQAEAVGGIAVPRSVVNALDAMNAAMAQSEASQWKIELLTDGGKGQQPFTDRQKYLDVLKVRAFGFPERAILEGQFGTKAEAESHGDVAVSNLEVRHAMVVLQYNLKIVDLILAWNYGPQAKGKVRIKPSPLADDTKAFFRQLYLAMIANPQGFMTEMSAIDMMQIRDRLGLPEHPMMQQNDPWGVGGIDPVTGQLLMPMDDGSGMVPQPPGQGFAFAFDPSQPRDGDGRWADVSSSRQGQVSSPAFKKWFGDSKIVDEQGKPLVVYHGSTKSFKAFGGERSGKTGNPNAQLGHFFTANSKEASRYATDWGSEGGNVRAVYLSIKKPYVMKYKEFDDLAMAPYKSLASDPDHDPNKNVKWNDREGQKAAAERIEKHEAIGREMAAKRRKELEAEGYDGIVVRMGSGDEYIAFHPKQIKSATGNRGTFDEADDDITMSIADEIDAAAEAVRKPTDAQREAGNYRKGHVRIHGLDISIETPRGEKRKKKWPKLPAHYGYFKGSIGADGDHVDVFVGPKPATEVAFVANMKGKDGKFDEHKVMLGFRSIDKARACLSEAYGEADHRIGRLTPLTIPQLKDWLSLPATTALAFNPDEPRKKKGQKGGGQWTKAGGYDSPAVSRMRSIVSRYRSFEEFTDPQMKTPGGRLWPEAAKAANANRGSTAVKEPQDWEVRVLKVADITPSQTGEDYKNTSSEYTAQALKEFAPDPDEDLGDAIHRVEDLNPIAVNEKLEIIDGNHRHAAHVMNGEKHILALVPVGKGTGRITNLEQVYHQLTGRTK